MNFLVLKAQVVAKQESLHQYVHRLIIEKGLSATDVELRAGGAISYSLVAGILAGDFDNLRCKTLQAIARGLGVAEERLFAVAIGSEMPDFQEGDFTLLYRKYQDLTEEGKEEIASLLELLHREIERLRWRIKIEPDAQHKALSNYIRLVPMRKAESLKAYVCRMLKEKRLTLKEVERRSQQTISATYVSNILNNRTSNLTIEKIKALARGLGVSPQEIFAILQGNCASERQGFKQSLLATLYHKYTALSSKSKGEMRVIMELVDREIDKRHLRNLRLSVQRNGKTRSNQPGRLDNPPGVI